MQRDRLAAAHGLDLQRHRGIFHRLKFSVTHAHLQAHEFAAGLRLRAQLDRLRYIGDEPAHELTPRLAEIFLQALLAEPRFPEVADHQRRRAPAAEALRDERGIFRVPVRHRRHHGRRGLRFAHGIEDVEVRERREPLPLLAFVAAQARPRLEPAFAREFQMELRVARWIAFSIEINRQHVADRRVREVALRERFHSAEHQESAAALADKSLEQTHLIRGEKLRLEVADDDRAVFEKLLRRFWEAIAQFEFILRVQPHEHRLVVAFDVFL